jgi:hypothetical protein
MRSHTERLEGLTTHSFAVAGAVSGDAPMMAIARTLTSPPNLHTHQRTLLCIRSPDEMACICIKPISPYGRLRALPGRTECEAAAPDRRHKIAMARLRSPNVDPKA